MDDFTPRLVGSVDADEVDLGKYLNTVRGSGTCPVCKHHGAVNVYEGGVQWACGCIQVLPTLYSVKMKSAPPSQRRKSKSDRGWKAAA